jgi:hypothetical protein
MIDAINRLAAAAELIFNVPSVEQLSALFAAGFITPLSLYLVACGVGSLVNFWRN